MGNFEGDKEGDGVGYSAEVFAIFVRDENVRVSLRCSSHGTAEPPAVSIWAAFYSQAFLGGPRRATTGVLAWRASLSWP